MRADNVFPLITKSWPELYINVHVRCGLGKPPSTQSYTVYIYTYTSAQPLICLTLFCAALCKVPVRTPIPF